VKAARDGDAEALGQLLDHCRAYLLLVAEKEFGADLRGKEGASDLVQETFVRALKAFSHFQGNEESEVLAWLRQILMNGVVDFARRYRNTQKRQIDRERSIDGDSSVESLKEQLAGDLTSPSGQAMARERDVQLEQALEELPEHYRQVILMRHRDNLSFVQIAALTEMSDNAARKLWWRAVKRLEQVVERSDER